MTDKRDDPRYRRLMEATRDAASGGYDAVSMKGLAEKCRMSMTTIYGFCRSKDQLIAEAHAGNMEEFQQRLHQRPRAGTAADRVGGIMRSFARSLEVDEVLARTLMRAIYSTDPNVVESRRSVSFTYAGLIDDAIGDDEVPNRAAIIGTLGHVIESVVLGWLIGRYDPKDARLELLAAVTVLLGISGEDPATPAPAVSRS